MERELLELLETLAQRSGRFRAEAYVWVLHVLEHTRTALARKDHISGRELLEGHRTLAIQEYGPMAFEVFRHWGLECTRDVGEIVFDLVDAELLRKTAEDTLADFEDIYDFHETFVERFTW